MSCWSCCTHRAPFDKVGSGSSVGQLWHRSCLPFVELISHQVATVKCIYTGGFLAIALIGSGTAVQAQSQQASQRVEAEAPERTSQSVTADELSGPMVVRQAKGLDGTEIVLANGDSIGKIDEIVI